MSTVQHGENVIHYDIRGSGEPILLFNHSGTSNLSWSERFLEGLAAEHTIITPDHRGTGGSSPAAEGLCMVDLAQDGIAVLRQEGIDRAAAVGASMGGAVAQEFALAFPEVVDSLVLLGTYAGESVRVAPEPWVDEVYSRIFQEPDVVKRWRMLLPTVYGAGFLERHEEVALELELKGARYTSNETLERHGAAVRAFDAFERLPDLDVRTLVVHGTADPIIPIANGELLADRIRNSELLRLEGVGHLPATERPFEVADRIRRFIWS
ncbi:MAG: alpha/beta hydrolase [Gammaproteobacteria bacterium]